MTGESELIAAIEAAVAADESNVTLQCHLAELLVEAGRHAEALGHAARVLQVVPDHPAALRVAAAASGALAQAGQRAPAGDEPEVSAGKPQHPAGQPPASGGQPQPAVGRPQPQVAAGQSQPPVGEPAVSAGQPPHPAGQPQHPAGEPRAEPPPSEPAPPLRAGVPDTADELLDQWAGSEPLPDVELGELTNPGVQLADVGGMEEVKRRLELSFLAPLRNPEMRTAFGKSLRGGLLLWGPPGCGKTFIARALAGELGASFYEIGLNDVLDIWIGSSERNLHSIFDTARRNRPCVLFFDEIDALGQKRTQLRNGGAMRGVVNQFLAELDGAGTDNEGLFVLAATNHPWDVDPALLRPGRFDRTLLVLPPDDRARDAILRLHLRDKPTEALDLRPVVRATEGLSGADLALICDHATERAMEASLRSGVVRPIRQDDLLDAIGKIRPSVNPWLETARNFAIYSNDGGVYDELLAYLKRRR